jgi:hypothetical protein
MDKLLEDYRMAMNRNEESVIMLEKLNKELRRLKGDSIEEEIINRIKNLNIRTKIINSRIEIKKNEIEAYK